MKLKVTSQYSPPSVIITSVPRCKLFHNKGLQFIAIIDTGYREPEEPDVDGIFFDLLNQLSQLALRVPPAAGTDFGVNHRLFPREPKHFRRAHGLGRQSAAKAQGVLREGWLQGKTK